MGGGKVSRHTKKGHGTAAYYPPTVSVEVNEEQAKGCDEEDDHVAVMTM